MSFFFTRKLILLENEKQGKLICNLNDQEK